MIVNSKIVNLFYFFVCMYSQFKSLTKAVILMFACLCQLPDPFCVVDVCCFFV